MSDLSIVASLLSIKTESVISPVRLKDAHVLDTKTSIGERFEGNTDEI